MNNHAKDLFQLQTELVDTKVDMAVSKSIDRVLDRIDILEKGMNNRFHGLEKHAISLEHRVDSNADSLQSVKGLLDQIRTKFIDYGFRAIAFTCVAIVIYTAAQFHFVIK